MSFASLWPTSKNAGVVVDEGLDEIFKSSAGPSTIIPRVISTAGDSQTHQKRKTNDAKGDTEVKSKKRRTSSAADVPLKTHSKKQKGKDKYADQQKAKRKEKEVIHEDGEHESEEEVVEPVLEVSDVDSDSDAEPPLHETLQKPSKKKRSSAKKEKYVPEGETKEQRDARSIFVGNLPVAIVKSKPMAKALKRHITSHIPTAKIESVRFRSVALKNPTTELPDDDEPSVKKQRSHKRAVEWQDKVEKGKKAGDEEEAEDKKGEKQYLTPAQKRRLAAIKGDVHESEGATVNAYVVFAHPVPAPTPEEGSEGRRKATDVMDPHEAAREAVKACDKTTFEGKTLRVDFVVKPAVGGGASDPGLVLADPKLSVFVGNLDFASTEDDLRAFFENIMVEERGRPGSRMKSEGPDDGESSEEETSDEEREGENVGAKATGAKKVLESNKSSTWVSRVRIVRDRDTQLGKGFAYVQFVDRDCVDELLALETEKLKFAKRTLRVQKCKTIPGAASPVASRPSSKPTSKSPQAKMATSPNKSRFTSHLPQKVEIPKGDPLLGSRIASLPKDERKAAKAADPTRAARRLAKKKARMTMEKEMSKGKERSRERRKEKGVVNKGKKDAKRRVRSTKSLEKRNIKK